MWNEYYWRGGKSCLSLVEEYCLFVGDGTYTLFWWNPWFDGVAPKFRFNRLFDLVVNKLATVSYMFSLGLGEGGEAWKWRRGMLAWEEDLVYFETGEGVVCIYIVLFCR